MKDSQPPLSAEKISIQSTSLRRNGEKRVSKRGSRRIRRGGGFSICPKKKKPNHPRLEDREGKNQYHATLEEEGRGRTA